MNNSVFAWVFYPDFQRNSARLGSTTVKRKGYMMIRSQRLKRFMIAATFATAFVFAGGASRATESDKNAVLAANAQFYTALNRMFTGDATPMKEVWSHADDVTYMGPTGGVEHGWSAVLKNWETQAAMKLGGKVEPADMHVIIGQDLAVLNNYEVGANTNADGKVAQVKLRATNIFRKEEGKWKMVLHQTDTLPYLTK